MSSNTYLQLSAESANPAINIQVHVSF